MKYRICCLVIGVVLAGPVVALEDDPEEVLNAVSEEMTEETEPVDEVIENWRRALPRYGVPADTTMDENGIIPLDGDKIISTISITPSVTVGQAGWVSSRIAAYEKAELEARYQIVQYLGQTAGASTSLELFEKSAFTDGEIEEVKALSKFERIVDKGGKLAESVLDNALTRLDENYDPEQYSIEEKHIVFSETLVSKQSGFAARLVTGAVTIHAGEGKDENGDYKMIVSLMWSPKLALLARNMSNQDYNMPKMSPGTPLAKKIPKEKSKLLANLGVRVVVNELGEFTVMAFGQAQPRKTSSARQSSAINTAQKKANNKARGYIVSFIQSNVRGNDSSTSEEKVREFDDTSYGVSNIDEYRETIKSISKPVKLVGLRTVKSWDTKHPETGQLVVGSVVSWSPAQQRSANDLNSSLSGIDRKKTQVEKKSTTSDPERMEAMESIDVDVNAY